MTLDSRCRGLTSSSAPRQRQFVPSAVSSSSPCCGIREAGWCWEGAGKSAGTRPTKWRRISSVRAGRPALPAGKLRCHRRHPGAASAGLFQTQAYRRAPAMSARDADDASWPTCSSSHGVPRSQHRPGWSGRHQGHPSSTFRRSPAPPPCGDVGDELTAPHHLRRPAD